MPHTIVGRRQGRQDVDVVGRTFESRCIGLEVGGVLKRGVPLEGGQVVPEANTVRCVKQGGGEKRPIEITRIEWLLHLGEVGLRTRGIGGFTTPGTCARGHNQDEADECYPAVTLIAREPHATDKPRDRTEELEGEAH